MAVIEKVVERLDELVKVVADLEIEGGRSLWFRGVRCHSYTLRPKIYRDGHAAEQVFERERRLLTRFRQRSQAYWRDGYPQTDWEQMFAMQHYGLPTRLLDWSENLMVAAYFAAGSDAGHAHIDDCGSQVWCVDPIDWNRNTPVLSEFGDQVHILNTVDEEIDAYAPFTTRKRQKSPLAIYGSHNTNRILAQRGTFMVWGNENVALEDVANASNEQKLYSFKIACGKERLASDLKRIGFTETMFFPEMVSLAAELAEMEGWR